MISAAPSAGRRCLHGDARQRKRTAKWSPKLAQLTQTQRRPIALKFAAYGAAWERQYRAERGAGYASPHDKIVLKAAKEWEVRYHAMYPGS